MSAHRRAERVRQTLAERMDARTSPRRCPGGCTCAKHVRVTEISPRQHAALVFIRDFLACEGVAPSHREIGEQLGIKSTNGVHEHLMALQRKGFIEVVPYKVRRIKITEKGKAA
jgi:DNA-binding MarR family transcriptional regulator